MKAGLEEARVYLGRMRSAVPCLHDPRCLYYGREGHLRLARECGVALNDFTEEAQRVILQSSYGMIYVAGCDLRPILDASEWMTEMRSMLQRQTNENT